MTGIYVRVERGGRFLNLELTTLSDRELDEYFGEKDRAELARWSASLVRWIRDNVTFTSGTREVR